MSNKTPEKRWEDVINGANEITELIGDDVVFIDGVAVYFHASAMETLAQLVDVSHEGDFMVSQSAFSDIRDCYEATQNKRLGKHEISLHGEAFDVYVERNNGLIIPYEDVKERSVKVDTLYLAALEHLLPLKLRAAVDRAGSNKGEKDNKDICGICVLINKKADFDFAECAKYIDRDGFDHLAMVAKGAAPMLLARKNAYLAKPIRASVSEVVEKLEVELGYGKQRSPKP